MSRYRFAVLGKPVSRSRSPGLHHAMLELAGLEGEYLRVEADDSVLAESIEDLRAGRWHGLNITMPLKAEAAKMSDLLSPWAERSGSVNTLSLRDGVVHGDSTDSTALAGLLGDERFRGRESILILGSGGAAAAALAAIPARSNIYLTARRRAPAERLTGRLGGEVVPWGTAVTGALVVNATPLGMQGERLPRGVVDAATSLIDLPYGEEETPAVGVAKQLGIPHADGHEFLLRQAIASFTSWTGAPIDVEDLQRAMEKA